MTAALLHHDVVDRASPATEAGVVAAAPRTAVNGTEAEVSIPDSVVRRDLSPPLPLGQRRGNRLSGPPERMTPRNSVMGSGRRDHRDA